MNKLIDPYGRLHNYLRVSVTDRCNLRCRYCMPSEGIMWRKQEELLSDEEIVQICRVFVSLGINKIRITGGEPLVRPGIDQLIKDLRQLTGLDMLAMTTNATLILPKLHSLRHSLDALNISLDTLRPKRFYEITRKNQFDQVYAAVLEAIKLSFPSLKLNVVVINGFNDDEILDFADFAYLNPINVRFIEFMPFKDNQWQSQKVVTYSEVKEKIESRYVLDPLTAEQSAVAKDYKIRSGKGRISFVTSVSDSFCHTCNRLRLTADGSLKSCLFFPSEVNLLKPLRERASRQDLQELIFKSLALKPEAHPPVEEIVAAENRAMIAIGG